MTKITRPTDFHDLLEMIGALKQDVAALTAAVDDLRYEIEEWQRLADQERGTQDATETTQKEFEASSSSDIQPIDRSGDAGTVAGTRAQERLRQLERRLTSGRVTDWSSEWDGVDAPDLPTGTLVRVDQILWSSVLDLRPAHVVEQGCDCEPGVGAPLLLAWHDADGWFLRELSSEEALALQEACLAAQSERARLQQTTLVKRTQQALW